MHIRTAFIAFVLFVVLLSPASAADPFFLGTWKFTSADVAPWASPAARKPNRAERDSFLGKALSIRPNEIAGPRVFTCQRPRYALKEYPAADLFQGAFGEMRERDPAIDPGKLAARFGFKGKSFTTLETGCEFDWHFVDQTTVKVGLNDWIYTLKKQ